MSDDTILDGCDTELAALPVPYVGPRATKTKNVRIRAEEYVRGKHIIAVVDGDNVILESDEADNRITSEAIR